MRLNSSVSQKDLYSLATRTLRSYGVTTSLGDKVLFFSYSAGAAGNEILLLVTGRALPDVPATNRPIFYIYSLSGLRPPAVRSVFSGMFPAKDLKLTEDMMRNALIFQGSQTVVNQAIEATRLLDAPQCRGIYRECLGPNLSKVMTWPIISSRCLAHKDTLSHKGWIAATIRLLPLESVNQLIVFTQTVAMIIDHVIAWAEIVEEEEYGQVDNGLFAYQVQSFCAEHIVNIVTELGIGTATGNRKSSIIRQQ